MAVDPLIFQARKYPHGDWLAADLPFEDVELRAADGTRLHGWYFDRQPPRGFMLYCHGGAENVAMAAPAAAALARRLRFAVLLFDYRGYGRSEGVPTEPGVLADARAARAWLCDRARIAPPDVVLMGRSLGGAIAVDLAADGGAKALIVENTFTSLPDLFARRAPGHDPGASFDSLAKIGRYDGPLLVSHAAADEWVPIELGERLFAAHGGTKRFVRLDDATHDAPRPQTFADTLDRFLTDLAGVR